MENEKQNSLVKNKLLGLEIIRFFSALSVLIFHYSHFAYFTGSTFVKEIAPFHLLLYPFYTYGGAAVPIFWGLSGFIFFWKYKEVIHSKVISTKQFFILRFSRLYPLHILTLMSVALLQYFYFKTHHQYFVYENNAVRTFLFHLFFASAWGFTKGQSFNGPIWSVSVEVVVYFLFFFTNRFFKNPFIQAVCILGFLGVLHGVHIQSHLWECVMFFYIGVGSSIFAQWVQTSTYKQYLEYGMWIVALTIVSGILVFKHSAIPRFEMCVIASCLPIALYVASHPISCSKQIQSCIEIAGNMTYSSYLIHFPLQMVCVVTCSFFNWNLPVYSNSFFLLYMSVTLTSSVFVYRYFEWPAQIWIRNRWL